MSLGPASRDAFSRDREMRPAPRLTGASAVML